MHPIPQLGLSTDVEAGGFFRHCRIDLPQHHQTELTCSEPWMSLAFRGSNDEDLTTFNIHRYAHRIQFRTPIHSRQRSLDNFSQWEVPRLSRVPRFQSSTRCQSRVATPNTPHHPNRVFPRGARGLCPQWNFCSPFYPPPKKKQFKIRPSLSKIFC